MVAPAHPSPHATAATAHLPPHAGAPTHAVVCLVPGDAHLVPTNAHLMSVHVHAGGDRYARGDRICMCPLPTPTSLLMLQH